MNRRQKLRKILNICDKRANKCEAFMEMYESESRETTVGDMKEAEKEEEILEILVQIIDIIE